MFGSNRDQYRKTFVQAWAKHQAGAMAAEPLTALELQLAQVCALHPEYHHLLVSEEAALGAGANPESADSQAFFHLGLHVALHEQLGTDRPKGIRLAYKDAVARFADEHQAQHRLMDCLANSLWAAQSQQRPPDERAYLECVKALR